MSFDYALERYCSHEVWFETAQIDLFVRDTVRFQRPPASNNVQLYIDGVKVPSSGLQVPASITAMNREPYRIKNGINDMIYLQVGYDTPRLIQLISGSVQAADLAANLQQQIPNLIFSTINGSLQILSRTSYQSDIFSLPNPVWSDKSQSLPTTSRILGGFKELGFIPGRKCIPQSVYPGWQIIVDPNSYINEYIIKFIRPLQTSAPFIQLTYVTNRVNCRRCFGSQIEFDYGVVNGTYETVENADLLLQEFDKFLFTKIGSHWKWPWLGSKISERIGSKYITSGNVTNAFISTDVSQAFKTYQSVKSQQDSVVFQQVTDAEFPLNFSDLSVVTDTNDPTTAIVSGSIVSRSRQPIELKRLIGNPSLSLLGSGQAPTLQRA
jgi:hypothetical protein